MARIVPTDADRQFLPAQSRRLHRSERHRQICGDGPRAGDPERHPTEAEIGLAHNAAVWDARATPAIDRASDPGGANSPGARAGTALPPRRPGGSSAATSRSPISSPVATPPRAVADAAFTAAQGGTSGRSVELGFHRPRRPDQHHPCGRSTRCAAIARAIEQRSDRRAAALIARVEDRRFQQRQFRQWPRRASTVVTTPAVNAAVARPIASSGHGQPPELRRSCAALRSSGRPIHGRAAGGDERFALVGVARVIRRRRRRWLIASVRAALSSARRFSERRRRRLIVARINAACPPRALMPKAQPRPSAARRDVQRSRSCQQQVPPPLIALFSIPPGKAWCRRPVMRAGTSSRSIRASPTPIRTDFDARIRMIWPELGEDSPCSSPMRSGAEQCPTIRRRSGAEPGDGHRARPVIGGAS